MEEPEFFGTTALADVATTKFNIIRNCLVFSLINVQQQYNNNIPLWRYEPKPWYKGDDLTLMKFAKAFIGTELRAKTGPRTSIRFAST